MKMVAVLLCTDDLLVVMPEPLLPTEASNEKRFDCHERNFLSANFKGVDILREDSDFVLS